MRKRTVTSVYPFFYRVLMTLLVVVTALGLAGRYLGMEKLTITHWALAFLVSLLLTLVSLGKIYLKLLSLLVLVISTVVMIPMLEMAEIGSFYDNYVLWMNRKSGFQEEWRLGYELIQMVGITLVCYILQLILEKKLRLKLGTAVLLFVGLVVCIFLKKRIYLMGMAGSVTFMLVA